MHALQRVLTQALGFQFIYKLLTQRILFLSAAHACAKQTVQSGLRSDEVKLKEEGLLIGEANRVTDNWLA